MPAGVLEAHLVKEQFLESQLHVVRSRSLRPWEGTSQACFLIFMWTCWFLPRQDACRSARPGLCEIPGVDDTHSKNSCSTFLSCSLCWG